jgi:hypothetical protein
VKLVGSSVDCQYYPIVTNVRFGFQVNVRVETNRINEINPSPSDTVASPLEEELTATGVNAAGY